MGDLKRGWDRVKFGELARCVNDRVDDPSKAGVDRYVGLEHLDPESLTIRRWDSPDVVESTKLRFRPGDIIFGKRRAYQRKLAVADFDGICSAHAMVLRAKPAAVVPEFLPFFMQSDTFMERAKAISVGSLSPTINWKALAAEEFALPPLQEQRRICLLVASLEVVSESLRQAISTATTQRMSAAKSLFSGLSSAKSVGDFVEGSAYGPRFPGSDYAPDGNVFTVRTTDFSANGGVRFESVPAARIEPRMADLHRLQDGDFLLSRSGEYAGMTRVFWEAQAPKACFVPAAFLIRFRLDRARLLPQFLYEYCESPVGFAAVRALAKGSAQPNISGTAFLSLPVPTTSVSRQREVCGWLTSLRDAERLIAERRAVMKSMHRTALAQLA